MALIFNLSKNLQRIYDNNFVNNPYGMISEKVEKQKKKILMILLIILVGMEKRQFLVVKLKIENSRKYLYLMSYIKII